jgi:hypothetical protein
MQARVLRVMRLLVDRYCVPVNGAAGPIDNPIAESSVPPNRMEGSHVATPPVAPDFHGHLRHFAPDEFAIGALAALPGRAIPESARHPGVGIANCTARDRRPGPSGTSFAVRLAECPAAVLNRPRTDPGVQQVTSPPQPCGRRALGLPGDEFDEGSER